MQCSIMAMFYRYCTVSHFCRKIVKNRYTNRTHIGQISYGKLTTSNVWYFCFEIKINRFTRFDNQIQDTMVFGGYPQNVPHSSSTISAGGEIQQQPSQLTNSKQFPSSGGAKFINKFVIVVLLFVQKARLLQQKIGFMTYLCKMTHFFVHFCLFLIIFRKSSPCLGPRPSKRMGSAHLCFGRGRVEVTNIAMHFMNNKK